MVKVGDFACRCCGKNLVRKELVQLVKKSERVGFNITIHSGYRCKEHNRAVGGAPRSQHLYGKAADISVPRDEMDCLGHVLWALWHCKVIGGISRYKTFFHIDTGRHRKW